MKRTPLRATAVLAPLLVSSLAGPLASAQSIYEMHLRMPGLVVDRNSAGEGPGPNPDPGGTPTTPQLGLKLSSAAVNFGSVATHTTATRQVLVSNTGTGALRFTAVPTVSGDAPFGAGLTSCGATLAVGADCLADASFSPIAEGSFDGLLTFSSELPNSPHNVTLRGTAYNPVSLDTAVLPRARVGQLYHYDFKPLLRVSNEESPDKSLVSWSGAGTLPSNLSFDTTTGILSGTPTTPHDGASYTVTSTYKSNQGQQVFVIKVGEAILEVVSIDAGANHACAITSSGAAMCWGQGVNGQLGNGSSTNSSIPVQVTGLTSGVTHISAATTHTCAVHNGAAVCWGANPYGQLGNGTANSTTFPVQVSGLTSGVTQVAAGTAHSCAIHNASAKCWGNATSGKLGNSGLTGTTYVPVQVTGLTSQVSALSARYTHSCAVHDGAAKCWGSNTSGQLGTGNTTNATSPGFVAGLESGVSGISAGERTSCAVHQGAAKCWGYNGSTGALGNGGTTNTTTAGLVSGLSSGVSAISVRQYSGCAIHNGAAKCWGSNTSGELGNGTKVNSLTPVQVTGLETSVTQISAGSAFGCAVTQDGTGKCWGYNSLGNLGDGTTTMRTTPVTVKP